MDFQTPRHVIKVMVDDGENRRNSTFRLRITNPNRGGAMQIAVHNNRTDLAEAFRFYVERRLRFSLDRFRGLVGQVIVRIRPDGPKQIRCFISIEVDTLGQIAVEERNSDLIVTIDRATGKLGRLVGRELDRNRDIRMSRESVRLVA